MNKSVLTTVAVIGAVGVVGFLAFELYKAKQVPSTSGNHATAPATTTAPATGTNANGNQWATVIGDVTGLFGSGSGN